VTNAHEGFSFVNQTANQDAAFYAQQLYPTLSAKQSKKVADLYAGLGSMADQNTLIYGECKHRITRGLQFEFSFTNEFFSPIAILICPTYDLLNAFPGRSYKARFSSYIEGILD
jgi:hypothetical protein